MREDEFYTNGEIWSKGTRGKPPTFVRIALATEQPSSYQILSGPMTCRICCECRGKQCLNVVEHETHHFRVGWRFEYPKKSDVKGWKEVEDALRENDPTNIIVRRSRPILEDPIEAELFSYAHMYHHADNIERKKKPRHKQW